MEALRERPTNLRGKLKGRKKWKKEKRKVLDGNLEIVEGKVSVRWIEWSKGPSMRKQVKRGRERSSVDIERQRTKTFAIFGKENKSVTTMWKKNVKLSMLNIRMQIIYKQEINNNK